MSFSQTKLLITERGFKIFGQTSETWKSAEIGRTRIEESFKLHATQI